MRRLTIAMSVLCLCMLALHAYAGDMGPTVGNLSAQEKQLWEAIKNGDMKTFAAGTDDDLLDLDAMGVMYDKKQLMDNFAKMKMTEYELSDFSVFALDKDCVVLTYKSTSTAVMDAKSMTIKVLNSTTYVGKGGKWRPRFHTETMIPEMAMTK